jgi:hypothetical protein
MVVMTRLMCVIAAALVAGVGCGDSKDDEAKGGGADKRGGAGESAKTASPGNAATKPQAVARAFVEAMIARDEARALTLLMTKESCAAAPEEQRTGCEQSAVAMRDQLHALHDDFPTTMVIDRIEKSAEEMRADHVTAWDVYAKGEAGVAAAIFVVTLGGKSYASYPVRAGGDPDAPEVPEVVEQ